MVTLSFFSVKGGTGKTVFNMMFASFLKYILGKRVLVLDFDGPEYNLSYSRKREMDTIRGLSEEIDESMLYPIDEVRDISKENIQGIAKTLKNIEDEVDYVIMDFPGSFLPNDAICLLAMEDILDAVIIPLELDGINIASSKALAELFQENGQKTLIFLNKVHGKEKQELYDELREWFAEKGITIARSIVKNCISMKKEYGNSGYLRSTVRFPMKDISIKNPGIIDLFKEVVSYVEREVKQENIVSDR